MFLIIIFLFLTLSSLSNSFPPLSKSLSLKLCFLLSCYVFSFVVPLSFICIPLYSRSPSLCLLLSLSLCVYMYVSYIIFSVFISLFISLYLSLSSVSYTLSRSLSLSSRLSLSLSLSLSLMLSLSSLSSISHFFFRSLSFVHFLCSFSFTLCYLIFLSL